MQRMRAEGTLILFPEAVPGASGTLGYVLNEGRHVFLEFLPLIRAKNVAVVPFSIATEAAAAPGASSAVILARVLARAWTASGERRVRLLGVGGMMAQATFHEGLDGSDQPAFWGTLGTGEGGVVWVLPSGDAVGSDTWIDASLHLRRLLIAV